MSSSQAQELKTLEALKGIMASMGARTVHEDTASTLLDFLFGGCLRFFGL